MNRWIAVILTFLPWAAVAEESKISISLGSEIGYLHLSPNAPEQEKSGTEGTMKLVFSNTKNQWIVDLAGGYSYSLLSSSSLQVTTRAFEAEFSPRYRFGVVKNHSWNLGPILQFFAGPDVSYSEHTYDGSSVFLRGGGKIQYEFGEDWICRIGVSLVSDLFIGSRRIQGALLELQLGKNLPVKAPPEPVASIRKAPLAPEFAEIKDRSIRIYLGEALLTFPTGTAILSTKAKEALGPLGELLARNLNSWGKIRIEGHTDIRNKSNRNQELSQQRALAVKKELVARQIPETKIQAQGLASSQPIDPSENEAAYLLNRRVEIWIDEVNIDKIDQLLIELRQLERGHKPGP